MAAKKVKPLDANELGKILHEEFERDQWGTIDPYYFRKPPKETEADAEGMGGLYEVLERVANRLNERMGGK